MVFDQKIYVANTSSEKIYVRTTYEKWQQLKFSTEVKLMSQGAVGGGLNFEQMRDMTEGFTALAPHHTIKMIGSFFSAEVDSPHEKNAATTAGGGTTTESKTIISRNLRVPNAHSIIVTSQHTVQVVRSGAKWKKQCKESCNYIIRGTKPSRSCWQRLAGRQPSVSNTKACDVCKRGEPAATGGTI
ncbi:uncharacterized protein [Asterias amurensis]|uniref:uncharacterized protein n=1 Tax=Asterias amurensis TaxID=7602 RepID=UPI003AB5812B